MGLCSNPRCGRVFRSKTYNQKYCSAKCRRAADKVGHQDRDAIAEVREREGLRPLSTPSSTPCLGPDCDRTFWSEDPRNIRLCPYCKAKMGDTVDPALYGAEQEWTRVPKLTTDQKTARPSELLKKRSGASEW